MNVRKLIGAAAVAGILFSSHSVVACECVAGLPLAVRSANADVILVAEVLNVSSLRHVVVRPIEVIKGQASETLTISTGNSDCDYFLSPAPSVGERYLLYLRRRDGELSASRCSLPGPITEKTQDLEALHKQFVQNVQPRAPGDAPKAARP
jgi:hypothetical protein